MPFLGQLIFFWLPKENTRAPTNSYLPPSPHSKNAVNQWGNTYKSDLKNWSSLRLIGESTKLCIPYQNSHHPQMVETAPNGRFVNCGLMLRIRSDINYKTIGGGRVSSRAITMIAKAIKSNGIIQIIQSNGGLV